MYLVFYLVAVVNKVYLSLCCYYLYFVLLTKPWLSLSVLMLEDSGLCTCMLVCTRAYIDCSNFGGISVPRTLIVVNVVFVSQNVSSACPPVCDIGLYDKSSVCKLRPAPFDNTSSSYNISLFYKLLLLKLSNVRKSLLAYSTHKIG